MSSDAQPSVFIVVLHWQSLTDTLHCLTSLRALTYDAVHVVVVDNTGEVRNADFIRAQHPHVTVLVNRDNLGYTGGHNIGIKYALQRGAAYIWLLNNDTVVTPGSLAALVVAGERAPTIGLISPVIYDYDHPDRVQFAGCYADRTSRLVMDLSRLASHNRPPASELVLWGAALLVKRAVVDRIGYLDERYFAYHEDIDYSLRALDGGFSTAVEPAAIILHKHTWKRADGATQAVRHFLCTRNWYLLWTRPLSLASRTRYAFTYLAGVIQEVVRLKREGLPLAADAVFDGARSALRGTYGPPSRRRSMPRVLKRLFSWHPYFWVALLQGQYRHIASHSGVRALTAARGVWRGLSTRSSNAVRGIDT